MMKLRNSFLLIAALVAGFYLTGCTEEDGPVGPGDDTTTYAMPTNLQVTSMSSTSIKGRWERGLGDVGVDTLIAVPVGGGTEIKVVTSKSATDTSATLTGLSVGVQYNIMVAAHGKNGRTAPVTWATATRSAKIRLWETADNNSGEYSGLILGTPNETSSTAKAVSTIGAEKDKIDLVLATDNTLPAVPYMALQGADVTGSGIPGGKAARVGNQFFIVAGGLDGDFYNASLSSEFSLGYNNQPIPATAGGSPIIILVRTPAGSGNWYYARVEVVPQGNGLLYGEGPAPTNYRYIDVIVSYQPTINVAYAGRPVPVRGFNTPKATAGVKGITKN